MLENQQNQLKLSSIEHGHLVQQILDSQKEFAQVGKTEIVSFFVYLDIIKNT